MQIPATGLIILVCGLALFAFAPRALYRTFIFFIPFSAFAAINYQGNASGHWLPATNYLGLLCLTREMLDAAFTGRIHINRRQARSLAGMFAFTLVAVASLAMPAFINGDLQIISADLLNPLSYPLVLSGIHMIHLSQLLFGVGVATLIVRHCGTLEGLRETIRIYIMSLIVVCIWGWAEYASYQLGVDFPYALFNNSVDDASLTGAGRVLGDIDVKRITSVAVEPSIMAQALVIGVPLVLMAVWQRQPLLSRKWDRVALLAIISTLMLSASSSAYVALAFALLATLMLSLVLRGFEWRPILWLLGTLLGAAAIYSLVPAAGQFVDIYLAGKLGTESGVSRILAAINGYYYFRAYPVLGVGWGTVSTWDVVLRLLANTGVIGLAVFAGFAIDSGWGALRAAMRRGPPGSGALLSLTAGGVTVAFAVLLFVMEIGGFTYEFLHVWLVFGLVMAAAALGRAEPDRAVASAAT